MRPYLSCHHGMSQDTIPTSHRQEAAKRPVARARPRARGTCRHLAVLGSSAVRVVLAGGPTLLQHLRIEMRQQFTFDGATVLVPHLDA